MSNRPLLSVLPVAEWPLPPGDRLPCALLLITADGVVHSANTTAHAWFEGQAHPMTPLAHFLGISEHDERMAALDGFVEGLRHTGQMRELRLALYRHTGERFSALLIGMPLIDPSGLYLGFDAMVLDLSRWQDRETLVPYTRAENLQAQLESRTRSQGLALRDMDAFAQILSHDLRSPLRHARGYLRLMREHAEKVDDPVQREYTQSAMQAIEGMNGMLDALLDFTRLSRVRVEAQAVPLGPLVQGLLVHLNRHPHAARVAWRIDPDLPVVRGDPMLLAQAFSHVLDNALKFTRSVQEPRIEVGWQEATDGTRLFYVNDNGVGFDRRAADKVFTLFQRQHHSLDYEGMGVGLALMRRIIERHGGIVRCESSPGQGCRVSFTLPPDLADSAREG
ncbi:ATP-binding protein [Hydrogenophaga sp. PML113]|uniref:sensor histidine kinase n=1 Tax=Hydrogenophaga sp. PML113 TaxID=1899350 RepID=UPI000B2132F4|nr:ATP-binding protein [Hydrogenophaga sp. PML113]